MIDLGLYLMYILTVVAVLAAMVFPLMYMVKNFQEAKKSLMGLGGMVALFILSWAIASGEVLPAWQKFNITPGLSKFIGGSLICMYLMMLLSAIALIYAEVKNMTK